jgi:hypothetical protein
MRKLISLLLASLLLAGMAAAVLGSGYRETAMDYLTEKYGVPSERIELYEGGITDLEFTAESFWLARYIIVPEGKSAQGFSEGRLPLPAPDQPADNAAQTRPEILPMPIDVGDIRNDGYIYGVVYIHIKTGEILEQGQMDSYYAAERRLAEQEWERLRREAGKLDVSLYRKLLGLSATDIVNVWIQPTPVETADLNEQFAALKEKYPDHTTGMKLSEILFYGYAIDLRGGGVSSPDAGVSSSYAVPDMAEPTLPLEKPGAEIRPMPMPNDDYWQEYNAMWEELEQIRQQAVIPSLEIIKDYLNGIGVAFNDNGSLVAAGLTVSQIHEIAELPAVSTVFEEAIFITMDGDDTLAIRSNAVAESAAPPAEPTTGASSLLTMILLTVAFLATSYVISRRRRIKK